ncbi:magnesium transporter [Vagococcus carniphilus]|uniref:magnesium transporter n=1 Tax=Vagococcus carniphilus TaxID=218144 RepID=UPI00289103E1|nr:magnesium transporter [Vagococcus carniphilus]MDT2813572.1 magnesium transporter [Vagococcus carniphilus]MDT2849676.1 magnesium transporter [Vagococcus carniphilus]MDT2865687.1 magnesium transporter [Vagococcus carniphilus]
MNENVEMDQQFEFLRRLLHEDKMAEFRDIFLDWHIYEQGQFYFTLDEKERHRLYTYLSPKEIADMFDVIEEDHEDMEDYLAEMSPRYVADMLNEMYTDNAVDLLNQLDKREVAKYLSLMKSKDAIKIKELLGYEDKTAGSIMATEYVSIVDNQTVRSALNLLKKKAQEAEIIYYVYVVSETNRLLGVISLRDLIVAEDDMLISDVKEERVISVNVADDQEDVAKTIRDYDFLAVPVVDSEGRLLGIITVDDIIDVIDDEAASDYSGLAGVDVEAIAETPLKASLKRLPWLITLLFLGMSTATLISHYEVLINEASILAVFISLITGTAGNAGTQSLAVAVRRLAISDDKDPGFFKLILNEVLTGAITGSVTGVVIFAVVGFWKHNYILGFVIGVAMFCAITVANLAGSFIPMLMEKLGFDPAVASGPFITTLSDLTSVLIYFNIASLFMGFFTGTQ